jgi:hypothetical protein
MTQEEKVLGEYLKKYYPFIIGASYGMDEKYPKDPFVRPHISYSKLVETFPHIKFGPYYISYRTGVYFLSSLLSSTKGNKKDEKFLDKLRNNIEADINFFVTSGLYPFKNNDKMLEQFLIYE